jgi:hypothetical protein
VSPLEISQVSRSAKSRDQPSLEISQAEAGVKSSFAAMRNTESNLWDG